MIKALLILCSLLIAGCATGPTTPAQRAAALSLLNSGALRQPPIYSTYRYQLPPPPSIIRPTVRCQTTNFGGILRTECR